MQYTNNFGISKPELNNIADIRVISNNYDIIDKGLTLDVGTSTGTANDYVLDLGSITLTADNKGISFKFWADRNSTGSVTINGIYNLLDSNLKAVKTLKAGVPYTIIYDGGSNFFLGSGGGTVDYTSTTVTADGKYVLEPYTFIGSDGEVHTGTMPNKGDFSQALSLNGTINLPSGYYNSVKVTQNITTRGAQTDAINHGVYSDIMFTRIPVGAYFTKDASGYPVIKSKITDVTNTLKNLSSDNKQEIISNLGGAKLYKVSKTVTSDSTRDIYVDLSSCPFTPKIITFYLQEKTSVCGFYNLETGYRMIQGAHKKTSGATSAYNVESISASFNMSNVKLTDHTSFSGSNYGAVSADTNYTAVIYCYA